MNAKWKTKNDSVEADLLEHFGYLLSGRALWKTMGYASSQAFRKAAARGDLPVRTFRIEHRRGLFAYSSEVAEWLGEVGGRVSEENSEEKIAG
ncbi:hypothetical protein AB4Y42_20285 [Paraburkholderia sp. EG286B]|uniref:hypothetical protein n=1 Tax=Paraburkholderia sp. EG286B TaxID=3237011 RepID=UPI0034D1BE09